MWTTDTLSENLVIFLCLYWTRMGEIEGWGGGGIGADRTSPKALGPTGESGGQEASERTSIKGLMLPGEWGGRQVSERPGADKRGIKKYIF